MHCTRRLRERRSASVFVLAAMLGGIDALASCSSSGGDDGEVASVDAATDAHVDAAETGDVTEDASPSRDAAPVDASPLPVVCSSPPCAIALVTTFGGYSILDDGQGFCALLQDHTVACWGANVSGQLGRGEEASVVDSSATPARVVGVEGIVELDHTCGVDEIGAVWCWGTGPFLRDSMNRVTTERSAVKLDLPRAKHVGAGPSVACASTEEGLSCWGENLRGQIGPFDSRSRSGWFGPTKIDMPSGSPVRQIGIGDATVVVREDGSVLTWGANPPIGRVSSMAPDPYPVGLGLEGVVAVAVATDNVCATAGGTGYCWGAAFPGAVDRLNRAYPKGLVTPEPLVQVATTRTVSFVGGTQVPYRWCAVTVTGDVRCWGFNENGQAGDGTKEFATDAVRVQGLPERAASVAITRSTSCALLTNGKIHCWGSNFDGQLGNGKNKGLALTPEEVLLP